MSRYTNETTHVISGKRIRESEKAVMFRCVSVDGEELEKPRVEWFPFSQVSQSFTDPLSTEPDWIRVKEWILQQKEMI